VLDEGQASVLADTLRDVIAAVAAELTAWDEGAIKPLRPGFTVCEAST
jgi:hypothetical protein